MNIDFRPSPLYGGGWTQAFRCSNCGSTGDRYAMYDRLPCPRCGERTVREVVAHWVSTAVWWWPPSWFTGYWNVKGSA